MSVVRMVECIMKEGKIFCSVLVLLECPECDGYSKSTIEYGVRRSINDAADDQRPHSIIDRHYRLLQDVS